MQTRLPSRDARARWQRRWPLLLLIIVLPIVAYLMLRPKDRGEEPGVRGADGLVKKPRYENRGVWRAMDGSRAKVPGVKGTVYDEAGRPLPDVVVTATTFAIAGNQNHVAGRGKTDPLGRFDLPLSDGSYYLTADKEGYGSTLALAHSGDEIGMVLLQSGVVEGKVTNEKGEPVTRFTVDVIGPSTDDMAAPAPFVSRRFDSVDGSFRINQLPDRPMYLRAMADGYAPTVSDPLKSAPGETARVDMTMTAGCVLTGVVLDGQGKPLGDVLVDAELRRSAGVIGDTSIDAASKDISDVDGTFRLANVPTGAVLVRAYETDHAPTDLPLQIDKCQDQKPIELRMSGGGGLTGVVRAADGSPATGVKLTLMNRAIGFVNTVTDAQGRYRLDRLPAGIMRIEAQRGMQRAVAQLAVEAGKVAERDLMFSAEGKGEVRGLVTASGKPLPGMQLLVGRSSGGGMMNLYFPVTGADGTYRVTGLPDGMYAVLVSSMNQVSSARVESGASMTVDFDVTKRPEKPTIPEMNFDAEEPPVE